ncbi:hypothetical protein MIR68_008859 [Amoeboaphelidium protococcarum]|nr:hypothetical protein MIR68_008859 [Amoeboaphelidium protococcarum]
MLGQESAFKQQSSDPDMSQNILNSEDAKDSSSATEYQQISEDKQELPGGEFTAEDLSIIKETMDKITVPDHCIPHWAKQIPENVWMSRLSDSVSTQANLGAQRHSPTGTTLFNRDDEQSGK